jgi:hypothetical protein
MSNRLQRQEMLRHLCTWREAALRRMSPQREFCTSRLEVDYPFSYEQESKAFRERIRIHQKYASDRWTKARRLYPITLLGPKLASPGARQLRGVLQSIP